MDIRHTICSSPARTLREACLSLVRSARFGIIAVIAVTWAGSIGAQARTSAGPRSTGGRNPWICGGDSADGICDPRCSGSPFDGRYDADCFSCAELPAPAPKRACGREGQPCEIHEGIVRMGAMVESGSYDASAMKGTVLAYWDGAAWDLAQNWGASALDGYVVYAVVRTALDFADEVEHDPTTRMALECMLLDHASRGIPTTTDNGTRHFHAGRNRWNSWSEDYMGFALGFAAADVWLATSATELPYDDRHYADVGDAVELAFSTDADGPLALTLAADPDPLYGGGEPAVMMRNHDEYSPVYGMVLLKHLTDVNDLYALAGLPPRFTCADRPDSLDGLYRWVSSKIEPNPSGAGYLFRDGACKRRDGVMSTCDDRPGDPDGSPGTRREPGHYPLARGLVDLCIAGDLEPFSAACEPIGPAGIAQAPHNYVFNCVFPVEVP